MGGGFSESYGSKGQGYKEPASIIPTGRGPNGELMYDTHNRGPTPTAANHVGIGHSALTWFQHRIGLLVGVAVTLCIILLALIVAILIVLAGNNDGGGDGGIAGIEIDTTTAPTPATAVTTLMPSTPPPSPSPSLRVMQPQTSFAPASLTIMSDEPTPVTATDEPTPVPTTDNPTPVESTDEPSAPPSFSCSLCQDGLPVADEYLDSFALTNANGRNLSCRELEIEIGTFVDDCFILQLIGGYRCGCGQQPHPESVCSLCPGGGLPPDDFKDATIENELPSDGQPISCFELYAQAALHHNTSSSCLIHQSRYGSQCGCPDVTRSAPPTSLPTAAAVLPPSPAPTTPCTLCSDGSLVRPEYHSNFAIRTTTGRNLTCLQLDIEISFFGDECLDLQLSGTYNCGCPPPQVENACHLCPGGGPPPEEFRETELEELGSLGIPLTCRDMFDMGYKDTDQTESACNFFQSHYPPQCGC